MDMLLLAVLDLIIIGFFFLLHPKEPVFSKENDHLFQLMDVSFQSPHGTFNATTITSIELASCTTVHLEFTDQRMVRQGKPPPMGTLMTPFSHPTKLLYGTLNTFDATKLLVKHPYIRYSCRMAPQSVSAAPTSPSVFVQAAKQLETNWESLAWK